MASEHSGRAKGIYDQVKEIATKSAWLMLSLPAAPRAEGHGLGRPDVRSGWGWGGLLCARSLAVGDLQGSSRPFPTSARCKRTAPHPHPRPGAQCVSVCKGAFVSTARTSSHMQNELRGKVQIKWGLH